jgi:hypothetical protein
LQFCLRIRTHRDVWFGPSRVRARRRHKGRSQTGPGPAGADGGVAGAERTARTVALIPSRASHQLRACAGDRRAVKTRVLQRQSPTPRLGRITDGRGRPRAGRPTAGPSRPRCARILPTSAPRVRCAVPDVRAGLRGLRGIHRRGSRVTAGLRGCRRLAAPGPCRVVEPTRDAQALPLLIGPQRGTRLRAEYPVDGPGIIALVLERLLHLLDRGGAHLGEDRRRAECEDVDSRDGRRLCVLGSCDRQGLCRQRRPEA